MSKVMDFLKPSWTKLGWFFVTYFVAQIYFFVIMDLVPYVSIASFIGFVLNPATFALESMAGIEKQLALPFANTINVIWIYCIAVILAKEIGKDK
jgi:hypothetical protein